MSYIAVPIVVISILAIALSSVLRGPKVAAQQLR